MRRSIYKLYEKKIKKKVYQLREDVNGQQKISINRNVRKWGQGVGACTLETSEMHKTLPISAWKNIFLSC